MSSSVGWSKGFGEECAGMYRKKKRRRSDADKEEIVGEAITRVMELLRVAGVPIPDGLCLTQSVHNRSVDNTAEDVPIENDGQNDNTAADNPKGQNDGPTQPDTIDLLTEPTSGYALSIQINRLAIQYRYRMGMQWCNLLMCGPMQGTSNCLSQ